MNSRDYWAERARQDKIKVIKTGEQGIDNLKRILKKNLDDVDKKIKDFYEKYGDNPAEKLSYAEFEKYKQKLRAKAKKYPQDKTLQKLAKQDIPKYKIDRLRALQTDLQMNLTEATAGQEAGIYKTLQDVGKVSQAVLASRFKKSIGLEFNTIANRKMKQLISSDWSGATWSKRLWKDRELVGQKLTNILEKGIPQGTSLQKMSRELRNVTGNSFNNAFRLIRTETSHIDGQVTLEGYKQAQTELGFEYYEYDAFLDSRTSEICRELDKKRFRIDEAEVGVNYPPMHPNCRSTTQLIIEDVDIFADDKEEKPEEKPIEYKTFNNGDDVNEFFYNQDSYKKWANGLTQDQKEAIEEYTGDLYSVVNDKLRGFYDTDDKMIQDAINQLGNSIHNFELKNNIQVYRGIDANALDGFMRENKINNYNDAIGKIYNDKGFMSTTPIKNLEYFKEKDVQFVINIPKGKGRGAYINDLSLKKDEEYEFLLQKDSKLKITDVKPIENTSQTIIFADLEI